MYNLRASHVLVLAACLIVITSTSVPDYAAAALMEAGNSSFTPQQSSAFWLSNDENYTFGFKEVIGNTGQYLLSIWRSRDPNKTAIWWASFGDGSTDPTVKDGATLTYTSTGSLQLYNSSAMLVWSSNTISSSGELQDTGNLRLLQQSKVNAVWQSLDHPTDSVMLVGLDHDEKVANKLYWLQSRRNQSSYAVGRFHIATNGDNKAYFYALDPISSTDYVYLYGVQVSASGTFQIGRNSSGKAFTNNNPSGTERLSLDYDANLRVYRWDSDASSWQAVWQMLDDKCMLASPCGPFGLCKVDSGGALDCSCPPGYHARVAGDNSQGCASNISFNASCATSAGAFYNTTIVEVPDSDFDFNDMTSQPGVGIDECKRLCLSNCQCMAGSYRHDDNTCFLKGNSTVGYLLNGYSPETNSLLIKVVTIKASDHGANSKRVRWLIGSVAAAVVLVAAGTAVACVWRLQRRRRNREENEVRDLILLCDAAPVGFKYQELVEATNNFSEPLGEGGFGVVYKGWVRGGVAGNTSEHRLAVAVKVLKGAIVRSHGGGEKYLRRVAAQGEKQFKAEVSTLGKIHHINLVRLLGYCIGGRTGESSKRLFMIFEYMEKGSLDRFLSPAHMQQQPLPWATRYSIALGTARGVAYLHHECNPRILHCDIKPQNVLLDEDFSPKVADFGFARRFDHQQDSHLTMSAVCGTRGYMAPEWLKSDEITSKVDVYSFGILLLQLVRGLDSVNYRMPLLDWAFHCMSSPRALQYSVGDSDDINVEETSRVMTDLQHPHYISELEEEDDQLAMAEAAEKLLLLKVGLWCVQPMPNMRPSMSRVVQLMEGTIDHVESPPNPAPIITSMGNLPFFLRDDDAISSSTGYVVNSSSVISPR